MASVRKREWKQDGKAKVAWVVDFKDERGKRTLKTFSLKKTADVFLQKMQQQLESGTFVADGNTVLFKDAAADWLKHCRKRAELSSGMTRATARNYVNSIARALPLLGDKLLTKVRLNDVQAVADAIVEDGLSGATVLHTVVAVRMVFEFAIERKWLRANPVETKKLVLPRKGKVLCVPSKDELRHLLQVAGVRPLRGRRYVSSGRVAIINLALFGGLRRGEIAALKWGDVDFGRAAINIRHSMSQWDGLKSTKTASGVREVPLVQPIAEALKALPGYADRDRNPDQFVFLTSRGRGMQGCAIYSEYWQPTLKAAGLLKPDGKPRYRLHDMRHTAVSLLIEQGLSPLHIKTMIGHASVTTTLNVYGHLFPSDGAIKSAADQVATALLATRVQQASPPAENPHIPQ